MKNPMMKLGGGGFIAWLVGAVLLIVALFSGVLFGSFDLTFKAGDAAVAIAGVGFIIEAIGMIVVGVSCFGIWKQYKTTLPSAAGAVGIVAGIISLVTGIFFMSGQAFAVMFLVVLLASLMTASFLLLLGLSMLALQEQMGGKIVQPAGIIALVAACSYLYGLSGIALVLVPTTALCMIAFLTAREAVAG